MYTRTTSFRIPAVLALGILWLGASLPSRAAILEWDAPTQTVDGQALSGERALTEYRMHCAQGDPLSVPGILLPPTPARWTTPSTMRDGEHTCAVTARNAHGASGPSNTVRLVCRAGVCTKPLAPTSPTLDVVYVVARNGTYSTRPLYDVPDGKQIGRVEILDGAQPRRCDAGAALKVTSSGEWRWTTNAAGLRGAALCVVSQ